MCKSSRKVRIASTIDHYTTCFLKEANHHKEKKIQKHFVKTNAKIITLASNQNPLLLFLNAQPLWS